MSLIDAILASTRARYAEALEAAREAEEVGDELRRENSRLREREAQLERENRLLTEEIRVREESQIPMIPAGAQRRLDAAEARVAELKEALLSIKVSPANNAQTLIDIASRALGPQKIVVEIVEP